MTITTVAAFENALERAERFSFSKAATGNTLTGTFASKWPQTGVPTAGTAPTAVAVCNRTTTGAIPYTESTGTEASYIANIEYVNGSGITSLEIHDRLVHMGGLSGTVTTAQTVSMDLSTLLTTNNLDARKGDANYSDVQWWLEWYTDTGATASNATVNVTYNDGTSGNLSVVAVGGTVRASRMIPLNSLIPAADSGKFIRDVNTVTLSASTGTAGSFGVTATRYRGSLFIPAANARFTASWSDLGLPEIFNSSALFVIMIANTTSTGAIRATGKIIHG